MEIKTNFKNRAKMRKLTHILQNALDSALDNYNFDTFFNMTFQDRFHILKRYISSDDAEFIERMTDNNDEIHKFIKYYIS